MAHQRTIPPPLHHRTHELPHHRARQARSRTLRTITARSHTARARKAESGTARKSTARSDKARERQARSHTLAYTLHTDIAALSHTFRCFASKYHCACNDQARDIWRDSDNIPREQWQTDDSTSGCGRDVPAVAVARRSGHTTNQKHEENIQWWSRIHQSSIKRPYRDWCMEMRALH